jgi:protein-S-isoprenylcysteine O-methyltransferase Ste14
MGTSGWLKGFLKTAAATVLYAAVHSFFASQKSKGAATRVLGERQRNAVYRAFYLLQAAGTMLILISYIRRQPRLLIIGVYGLASVPFRIAQLAGVCWAVAAAYEVGYGEILGIRPVLSLVRGDQSIPPESEAQGPAFEGNQMRVGGPFRLSRHPLNLAPLAILWFNPRISTNLLAYNLVSTLYLVLGSHNEEHRLAARYGQPYGEYQASEVPFYLPNWI